MVMQDPQNVRAEITPRLDESLRMLWRQVELLDEIRPRLDGCAQPSPTQLASHRAQEQGDARLLRTILAVLSDSIPQLGVVADLLSSALKHALDRGAARDALPALGQNQTQDQIAEYLLARPRTTYASFHPHLFPESVHIALSSLRLAKDYYLDRCIYILRRLGLPDRSPHALPVDHAMVEARAYLERASALLTAAHGHNFDAIYARSL